jgi:hypothetical protein
MNAIRAAGHLPERPLPAIEAQSGGRSTRSSSTTNGFAIACRTINLQWHACDDEYASSPVERCVPLAQVRDPLGHPSLAPRGTRHAVHDHAHSERLIATSDDDRALSSVYAAPIV